MSKYCVRRNIISCVQNTGRTTKERFVEANLEHQERFQLAVDICGRLVETYPNELVLGGVYGSTAQGADIASSDLELLFVTREGCKAEGKTFIFRDTSIGYEVHQQSKLEESVRTPSLDWPFQMGVLSVLRVLHGDPGLVQGWLRMGRAIPLEESHSGLV